MTSEIPAGGLDFHVPNGAEFVTVAFSPDGKFLAVADWNGYIYVRAVSQLGA